MPLLQPQPSVSPVDAIAPQVRDALAQHGAVVVVAPPGTGKTTRLPLLLAEAGGGRLILTEPRRVATRAAASRMAATLGERVGETVGYRMRDETRVGPRTRIEVVTEGVFLRMIQHDPSLDGVSVVLCDEVHERSLDVDLSLALALDARRVLRPDLNVVAMSATLEGESYARLLNGPVVSTSAAMHRVDVVWRPTPAAALATGAADAIVEVLSDGSHPGDVLVFLPGNREIRAVERRLRSRRLPGDAVVHVLTGATEPTEAGAALRPDPNGRPKVVLATAVAQTSLTIPGVRTVIDSGLARRSSFVAEAGVTRLVTERVSKSTAVQRAGRAGREAPGRVIRLWSAADFDRSADADVPELADADLTDTVLQAAVWGVTEAAGLPWLEPPPAEHWAAGAEVLRRLGALDADATPTERGRRIAALPVPARLGGLLLDAAASNDPETVERACVLAAELLGGSATPARLRRLVTDLSEGDGARRRISDGLLAAHAFPERIAARAGADPARYVLSSGIVATLGDDDPNRGASLLVALDLDGDRRTGRVFRSSPITLEEVRSLGLPTTEQRLATRTASGRTEVTVETRLGQAVIERRQTEPNDDDVIAATLATIDVRELLRAQRIAALRARVALLQSVADDPAAWPDWSEDALADRIGEWLVPALRGRSTNGTDPLRGVDLADVLSSTLTPMQRRDLHAQAPVHIEIPTGRSVAVDYLDDGGPTIEAKLQEFFGTGFGPRLAWQRVPLRLVLLSPAGRPAAITADLAGFWTTGYPAVRADLRGRYPKHPWPDDPTAAVATARAKPRT